MGESFRIQLNSEKKIYLRSGYVRINCGDRQLYGGDQAAFGGLIESTGCGLIAMADISLYLSGNTELTAEEYESYIRSFNEEFVKLRMRGGMLGKKFGMCNIDGRSGAILKGYFRSRSKPLSSRIIPVPVSQREKSSPLTEHSCFKIVAGSVSADKPIILGIGPSESSKLPLYVRDSRRKDRFIRRNSTSNHYVTVTGVVVCSDADTGSQRVLLRVSSWGKKYFIDLEELYGHIAADPGLAGKIVGRISNNLTIITDKF